jgi:hypothetical protein
MIVAACERHNVDPHKSGWVSARERTAVAPTVLTPETVHGVAVNHPELAEWMRRAGWFSGQRIREDRLIDPPVDEFDIHRDAAGSVTHVQVGTHAHRYP